MPKFFHWIRGKLFLFLYHLMQPEELYKGGHSSATSSTVALDALQLMLRISKYESNVDLSVALLVTVFVEFSFSRLLTTAFITENTAKKYIFFISYNFVVKCLL